MDAGISAIDKFTVSKKYFCHDRVDYLIFFVRLVGCEVRRKFSFLNIIFPLILRADCTQVQFLNLNDFVRKLKSNLPMLCVLLDNATSLPIWLFKTSRRRENFFSFTRLTLDLIMS